MTMSASHPDKVYVELTTRCNLHCPMCVKYAAGSSIPESDLAMAIFARLAQDLPYIRELILNGIGEPLLHPELPAMLEMARALMPSTGIIGFQSNGLLLDQQTADRLIAAGLDTVCLSLDHLWPERLPGARENGHALTAVSSAVSCLRKAREAASRPFRIGLETVLSRHNVKELPAIVEWAGTNGVDYLLATHLFKYGDSAIGDSLFDPHCAEARTLFAKYRRQAAGRGLSLEGYVAAFMKFTKSARDLELLQLVEAMQAEARAMDLHLHLESLAAGCDREEGELVALFARARESADAAGLEFHLPELQASRERTCLFMKSNSAFIDVNGEVMPCHFLWHSYSCRVNGERVPVQARSFGTLSRQTLGEIWLSQPYVEFRQEVMQAGYAPCWTCQQGPCPTLVNDGMYANDCYGSRVPCGHCQWGLGAIRCL